MIAVAQAGRTGRTDDQIAEACGIPAGQWNSVQSTWMGRIMQSLAMAQRQGRDLDAEVKRVRQLRKRHGAAWFPAHLHDR